MSTSPEHLHYLLLQYANNNCTRKELLELLQAMEEAGHDNTLRNSLQNIWQNISDSDQIPAIDKDKLFSNIIAAAPVYELPAKRFTWLKVAAAAVLVLALGSLAYMYLSKKERPPQKSIVLLQSFKNDRAARISKAILSLADGSEIIVDDAPNGTLARQGNTTIIKRNKQLIYTSDAAGKQEEALHFNILTTPPGLQYEVVLPDESHVWVNAATAVRFPTAFNSNERSVAMTGEAYFEVAPAHAPGEGKKKIPFMVDILPPTRRGKGARAGRVEVLGTHFNIKAYDEDEDIKTTLLEGKVLMRSEVFPMDIGKKSDSNAPTSDLRPQTSVILKPGQQAQLKKKGDIQVTNDINVNEVIAWKKGELIFNNLTMAEAAQIIERWYNVRVVIKNPRIATCRVTVSFLKGETIQQVMDVIGAYNDFTWQMKNGTITLSGKGCE
ncbi:MAG TPA: FecR domain-containing protein [Niastella sp.]